jgi:hypothetical protein
MKLRNYEVCADDRTLRSNLTFEEAERTVNLLKNMVMCGIPSEYKVKSFFIRKA